MEGSKMRVQALSPLKNPGGNRLKAQSLRDLREEERKQKAAEEAQKAKELARKNVTRRRLSRGSSKRGGLRYRARFYCSLGSIDEHPENRLFPFPDKLYGRESEVDEVLNAYHRVAEEGPELLVIKGEPGAGKSVLVDELLKCLGSRRGFFISGKFEQYKAGNAYGPIAQAFGGLVQYISTTNAAPVWRRRILQAIGRYARVVADVVPELEVFLGRLPGVPTLGPIESQNRLHHFFVSFVALFATKRCPLVMLLDDLQWADKPSLTLLSALLAKESIRILIVGTARTTEMKANVNLIDTLDDLKSRRKVQATIYIQDLAACHVEQMLRDSFQDMYPEGELEDFVGFLMKKTGGSPLFLTQYISSLWDNNALYVDEDGIWRWNLEEADEVSEGVVDMMVQRIKRMDPHSREVLKLASCLGARFSLDKLVPLIPVPTDQELEELTKLETVVKPQDALASMKNKSLRSLSSPNLEGWRRGSWLAVSFAAKMKFIKRRLTTVAHSSGVVLPLRPTLAGDDGMFTMDEEAEEELRARKDTWGSECLSEPETPNRNGPENRVRGDSEDSSSTTYSFEMRKPKYSDSDDSFFMGHTNYATPESSNSLASSRANSADNLHGLGASVSSVERERKVNNLSPVRSEESSQERSFGSTSPENSAPSSPRSSGNDNEIRFKDEFGFAHDYFRQAAYSLINEEDRPKAHFDVGRMLLEAQEKNQSGYEADLVEIANQFVLGLTAVDSGNTLEREKIARVCIAAGTQLQSRAAFDQALKFYSAADQLLGVDRWETSHDLAIGLSIRLAEVSYLAGNVNQMDSCTSTVLSHATRLSEKIHAHQTMMVAYTSILGDKAKALEYGVDALKLLGTKMSMTPYKSAVFFEIIKTQNMVKQIGIDNMGKRPLMKGENGRMLQTILALMFGPAYQSNNYMWCLVACKMVQNTIMNGISPVCPYGFAAYAVLCLLMRKELREATLWADLAESLAAERSAGDIKSMVRFLTSAFVNTWTGRMRNAAHAFLDKLHVGPEHGEVLYTGYRITMSYYTACMSGENLFLVDKKHSDVLNYLEHLRIKDHVGYSIGLIESFGCLRDEEQAQRLAFPMTDSGFDLPQKHLNEGGTSGRRNSDGKPKMKRRFSIFDVNDTRKKSPSAQMIVNSSRVLVLTLLRDHEKAYQVYLDGQPVENAVAGLPMSIAWSFFSLMSMFPVYRRSPDGTEFKEKLAANIARELKKFKPWQHYNTHTFLHRWLVLEAEWAYCQGNIDGLDEKYEKARSLASESGHLQIEGLCLERWSRFVIETRPHDLKFVGSLIAQAHQCFVKWGAIVKARDIEHYVKNSALAKFVELEEAVTPDGTPAASRVNSDVDDDDAEAVEVDL